MNKGVVLLVALLGACGDDEPAESADGPFCEGYDKLALRVGCKVEPDGCEIPPACEAQGKAWLACVNRDTSQCYCEPSDRNVNCEGSFKPSEGPARCIAEYEAFDVCMDP